MRKDVALRVVQQIVCLKIEVTFRAKKDYCWLIIFCL